METPDEAAGVVVQHQLGRAPVLVRGRDCGSAVQERSVERELWVKVGCLIAGFYEETRKTRKRRECFN
jgi:hypothetical protein